MERYAWPGQRIVGKLTDDDLERTGGKIEQLIGILQQKYGYTREHAEQEFKKRVEELKETNN